MNYKTAFTPVFSSPEPKAHCCAYSIGRHRRSSSVCQHFQTSSPQKPLGQLKPNFMWRLYGSGERKLLQTVMVTWSRWPPCPYMVKTLKNRHLRNQKAGMNLWNYETWYAASGTQVLQNSFKWWPWVNLDLFYSKVKFGPLCFCMGKKVRQWIFQKLLSSIIWNYQQMTEVTKSFRWHQNFVPWGLYATCPGDTYMY